MPLTPLIFPLESSNCFLTCVSHTLTVCPMHILYEYSFDFPRMFLQNFLYKRKFHSLQVNNCNRRQTTPTVQFTIPFRRVIPLPWLILPYWSTLLLIPLADLLIMEAYVRYVGSLSSSSSSVFFLVVQVFLLFAGACYFQGDRKVPRHRWEAEENTVELNKNLPKLKAWKGYVRFKNGDIRGGNNYLRVRQRSGKGYGTLLYRRSGECPRRDKGLCKHGVKWELRKTARIW